MIILILLSIIATAFTSFLISFGFYFIAPSLFYSIFWITFGCTLIVMEPINRILRRKSVDSEKAAMDSAIELGKLNGKQSVALECEYCGVKNPVKIELNAENAFRCKDCKNDNKVLIQFTTSRMSIPLELDGSNDGTIVVDEEEDEQND